MKRRWAVGLEDAVSLITCSSCFDTKARILTPCILKLLIIPEFQVICKAFIVPFLEMT